MPHLRIVLGYKSENYREEVPTVLYLGPSGDEANRIGETAPDEFHRVELVTTHGGQKLRKRNSPVVEVPPPVEEKVEQPVEVDLEKLTVAQLKERCEASQIDVSECKVKADYIAALRLLAEVRSMGHDDEDPHL